MRNKFTLQEWRTLQFAPLWVFSAVAAADGNVEEKEFEILARELSEAHLYKNLLARDVLLSVANEFAKVLPDYGADPRDVVNGLKEVADILDRKVSPQDRYEFKRAMLGLGYNVVETSSKGMLGFGKKAREQKHKALDVTAIIMRFSMVAPSKSATSVGTPPTQPTPKRTTTPAPKPKPAVTPVVPTKHTSIYLVIDSSRYVSDLAYYLDGGISRFPEKLRARPQRGVRVDIAMVLADNTGRIVTPLTDAKKFSAPSLLGRGTCNLGQAISNVLSDLTKHPADGKPLIVVILGGEPEDEWTAPAEQLHNLAKQGLANVFVFGVAGYSDEIVLKRLTTMSPLVLSDVLEEDVQSAFDWLYQITDVILSGLESGGASGQRKNVPAPPACLKVLQ